MNRAFLERCNEVETTLTVAQVKSHIEATNSAFPAAQQKLIHAGKVLKDDSVLGDSGIKEEDFLVVMVSKPKKTAAAPAAAWLPAQRHHVPLRSFERHASTATSVATPSMSAKVALTREVRFASCAPEAGPGDEDGGDTTAAIADARLSLHTAHCRIPYAKMSIVDR